MHYTFYVLIILDIAGVESVDSCTINFSLKMKMDLIFSDCWYRNLEHISQSAAQRNVTQESFPYEREAFTQLSQVNENQPVFENESDFIAFWNKNCLNHREQCETKQTSNSEHNSRERSGFNDLDEILNHVPCLPSNLKNIKGKEMNFVMIATSMDTRTMVENLENILDKTEFQALPLSFNNQGMELLWRELGKLQSKFNLYSAWIFLHGTLTYLIIPLFFFIVY